MIRGAQYFKAVREPVYQKRLHAYTLETEVKFYGQNGFWYYERAYKDLYNRTYPDKIDYDAFMLEAFKWFEHREVANHWMGIDT